jgi:DNA-binding beta-propeller fold protein YncE
MKNRRITIQLASASVLLASAALAADMPTGAPNQSTQLDLLLMPSDVAIASGGQTYVVDSGNHQIAVFDAAGTRLTSLGMMGEEEGQLMNPLGIGVSAKGEVWVADKGNERSPSISRSDPRARNSSSPPTTRTRSSSSRPRASSCAPGAAKARTTASFASPQPSISTRRVTSTSLT